MIDFSGKRWWYLGISLVLFLIAAVALAIPPRLEPGIEFTSGSSFTLQFNDKDPGQDGLRQAMKELGYADVRIQTSSLGYLVRTRELQGAPALNDAAAVGPQEVQIGEFDKIKAGLQDRYGAFKVEDFSTVSSTISTEIAQNAVVAVAVASLAILIYISIAFRKLPRPWRYGTCAIIALLHDAFIVLGLFSILGKTLGTEVDTGFITAILTVIGFSVHDTIVVYDRIRENITHDPYIPFEEAVNASLTETLARSINTSFVVVLTVVAMLLIGGVTIRNFLIVLLVGIVSGTYSSVGIAAQLLVAWENKDLQRFWRRLRGGGRGSVSEEAPAAIA